MSEEIILTGACAWNIEAVFQKVRGIKNVESGMYNIEDYDIAFGKNDQIEAVRFTYEPEVISFETILAIFYSTYNPTIINWDKESCFYPNCRSLIICSTEAQKEQAHQHIVKEQEKYEDPIQTKVIDLKNELFFLTEERNRSYYTKYPDDAYCISMITPKIEKARGLFPSNFKLN